MVDINFLEEERKKIWERLEGIEKISVQFSEKIDALNKILNEHKEAIEKKTSDYEKDAKGASKKASEYKNKSLETYKEIENAKQDIVSIANSAHTTTSKITEIYNNINVQYNEVTPKSEEITEIYDNILEQNKILLPKIDEISESLETLNEMINTANLSVENAKQADLDISAINKKISTLHSQAASMKSEIGDIYDEIMGYDYEDEESGESKRATGLKDKLDKTYDELEKNLEIFSSKLTDFKNAKINEYDDFVKQKNESFQNVINKWETAFSNTDQKIKSLLPDALTAGLSYAYEEKRKLEEKDRNKFNRRFRNTIVALVFISLIPFAISSYLLFWEHQEITTVIKDLPHLACSILPFYIPIFWLAWSSNRKANLAKRLIEEYSHKEVLSKTFEGLSSQIKDIDDDSISKDLRVKLLYNIISVSSDNPGKLISDYQTSDNPIIEVLDKSINLSKSIEKLNEIPGMSIITKKLAQKQKNIVCETEKSVSNGVDVADAITEYAKSDND